MLRFPGGGCYAILATAAIAFTPFVIVIVVRLALGSEMAGAVVQLGIAFILGAVLTRAWLLERHHS